MQTNRRHWSRALLLLLGALPLFAWPANYKVLGWNDLGMHCMDADYAVFSILPPYNNLHAQLVDVTHNKLVTSGATLTFESATDTRGSINTYSLTKTNFWDYSALLFGVDLMPGKGLTGFGTASGLPQALLFDPLTKMHAAQGIPITPIDDNHVRNTYPMVRVVARDAGGAQLAAAQVVLPVSDEMSCIACHASDSDAAARPVHGWVHDPRGPEQDYRRNVLSLHDDRQLQLTKYKNALKQLGLNKAGLLATADGGHPILCAACHSSNALPGTGLAGISPMTRAVHALHATVINPATGLPLDAASDRNSCYMCHPGSQTQCLRGVMGNAKLPDGTLAMQCQSCHSHMSKVGSKKRVGWFDQPNCQACHHDSARDLTAVDANGNLKHPTDARFATNPNVPATGYSLYRFSAGHGGLQCEACHGSTHAEFASSEANDNVLPIATQGHVGTLAECTACHQNQKTTATGGPHGLHTIGAAWVSAHGDVANSNHAPCAYCHGSDYRGGALATTKSARIFNVDGKSVQYTSGQQVTCYDCHNGPGGSGAVARKAASR